MSAVAVLNLLVSSSSRQLNGRSQSGRSSRYQSSLPIMFWAFGGQESRLAITAHTKKPSIVFI
jgi:hypothetical protein